MQLKTKVVKALMLTVLACSLLWVVTLLSTIGNIYFSHTIPYSFNEWAVHAQIGSDYWVGRQPHSTLFYLIRFYVLTAMIITAGVLSGLYLKRLEQRGNRAGGE